MCKMKWFPKDENSNAEEEHLETPCPLLWYRYIITQIKLLFQPPIQTPPYISDLLKRLIAPWNVSKCKMIGKRYGQKTSGMTRSSS